MPKQLKKFYSVVFGVIFLLTLIFLLLLFPVRAATYYYITGPLNTLSSWKTGSNGSGSSPASFTGNNTFIIWNSISPSISPTLTGVWNFGGAGTTILQIGTNTGSATLTISGGTLNLQGNAILRVGATTGANSKKLLIASNGLLNITSGATNPLRVYNNATLTIASSTFPASGLVQLNTGSYVEWAQTTGTINIWQRTYQNMIISGGGIKQHNGTGTLRVRGHLQMLSSALRMSNNTGSVLRLSGTISGTAPIQTSNSNLQIDGAGAFGTIYFANGNTAMSIRNLTINRTSAGQIILGTNLTVSGVTNYSNGVINLNNNTLTLSGALTLPAAITNGYFIGSRNSSLVIGGTGAITNSLLMSTATLTTSSLYNLTMNRANRTLTIGNALRIWGELTATTGTIATGGNVTIKADNLQRGRVGPIGTNADITGNVTMEVYAQGGSTGWTLLGISGIQSQSFTAWTDDFPISCPSGCPYTSTFVSVYSYCEPCATNNYSAAAHYVPISNASVSAAPGTGYWVYLGTSSGTTNSIVIDATGGLVKKNFGTIALTRTGPSSIQNGWNLIANPYPSPIAFTNILSSMSTQSTNIDHAIYVWNPDLNGGNGDYAVYTPSLGSVPPVSSGGIDNNIPAGQGFFVHAWNSMNLSPNENWKTSTNSQNFLLKTMPLQTSSSSNLYPPSLFMLEMKGPNNYDVFTGIAVHPNATNNFDTDMDALQMGSEWPAPQLMSVLNNTEYKINSIPLVNGTTTLEIKSITGVSGTYTILPINLNNFSSAPCITLYDKFTGTNHNLTTGSYTFNLADTTTVPRFILSITNNSVSATANVLQHASCNNTNDGVLKISGSGYALYNYKWKDAYGNVIANHVNIAGDDTLFNVLPGIYFCEVSVPSSCASATYSFVVNANNSTLPAAAYSLTTPAVLPLNFSQPFSAINTSSNAANIQWELVGDGYTASNPVFSYMPSDTGEYILRLHAYNNCNDESIYEQNIRVTPGPDGPFSGPLYDQFGTAIGTNREAGTSLIHQEPVIQLIKNENGYKLKWTGNENVNTDIQITDMTGRIIFKDKLNIQPGINDLNMLHNISTQWLIINLEYNNKLLKEKIFIEK